MTTTATAGDFTRAEQETLAVLLDRIVANGRASLRAHETSMSYAAVREVRALCEGAALVRDATLLDLTTNKG